jgi:hypothetical protein
MIDGERARGSQGVHLPQHGDGWLGGSMHAGGRRGGVGWHSTPHSPSCRRGDPLSCPGFSILNFVIRTGVA